MKAQGDTKVDDHHSVEDIGICLGKALKEAVGDKAGIYRYGFMLLPMDEALAEVAVKLPPELRMTDISSYSTNRLRFALNNGLAFGFSLFDFCDVLRVIDRCRLRTLDRRF